MRDNKVNTEKEPTVNEKDIEKIVEEMTNIPVGELKSQEQEQLRNLTPDLEAHVIGQNNAVEQVSRAIRQIGRASCRERV